MTTVKYHCPFCSQEVSYNHFGEHILKKHEAEVFSKALIGNHTRLPKSYSSPLLLKLTDKSSDTQNLYYTCLGCLTCCKKQASTQNHFPKCAEAHKKKCKELYDKYCPSELKDKKDDAPVILQQVVQGWTDEQVNALLGSMLKAFHSYEYENEEFRRKIEYYEDKIKDLPEETQEEIEESLPEAPDDDEVDLRQPEDITDLWNMSARLGFRLQNSLVEEAFKKWIKMPLKKPKTT